MGGLVGWAENYKDGQSCGSTEGTPNLSTQESSDAGCRRLNNGPPSRYSYPNPRTCDHITFRGQRKLADVIRLRILQWVRSLDYPSGSL